MSDLPILVPFIRNTHAYKDSPSFIPQCSHLQDHFVKFISVLRNQKLSVNSVGFQVVAELPASVSLVLLNLPGHLFLLHSLYVYSTKNSEKLTAK